MVQDAYSNGTFQGVQEVLNDQNSDETYCPLD
jgi:hypothetical protein